MQDRAYVVGGFDGHQCHNTVEQWDPRHGGWAQLARRMHQRRSGVAAAELLGALFVAGGFTGRSRLSSVEFYDPREGIWHHAASMRTPR